MKFAAYSVLVLLFCASVFACKNQPETNQESTPEEEVEIPAVEEGESKKQLPTKINPTPIEQKSDRRIHKKKKKSALDTLRPKSA